jgi:hypothetical protein
MLGSHNLRFYPELPGLCLISRAKPGKVRFDQINFGGNGVYQGLNLRLIGRAIFASELSGFDAPALAIMNKNPRLNRVAVSMVRRGNHPSRLGRHIRRFECDFRVRHRFHLLRIR